MCMCINHKCVHMSVYIYIYIHTHIFTLILLISKLLRSLSLMQIIYLSAMTINNSNTSQHIDNMSVCYQ